MGTNLRTQSNCNDLQNSQHRFVMLDKEIEVHRPSSFHTKNAFSADNDDNSNDYDDINDKGDNVVG